MRYIAMQLRLLLHKKFPEAPEDDILKVIGNLLYYRYMNPAIVAPDAFDIVDVSVEQQMSAEQVCLCVHIFKMFTMFWGSPGISLQRPFPPLCVCVFVHIRTYYDILNLFPLSLSEKEPCCYCQNPSTCFCLQTCEP